MTIQDRFPALASRDFLIFWVGQFISLIGTWMQNTTQPYLAYRITGSSLDLGLIAFSATLPTLILALPGGVLVERMNKRKVVIVLQVIMMIQAFILAFLALTGRIQIWHLSPFPCSRIGKCDRDHSPPGDANRAGRETRTTQCHRTAIHHLQPGT